MCLDSHDHHGNEGRSVKVTNGGSGGQKMTVTGLYLLILFSYLLHVVFCCVRIIINKVA